MGANEGLPYGLVVRIPGFHPGGPGSIPGVGTLFFLNPPCQTRGGLNGFTLQLDPILTTGLRVYFEQTAAEIAQLGER